MGLPLGRCPFSSFTPASALSATRELLTLLEIPKAAKYRIHDFRRGHARDIQSSGATLAEILRYGEWHSPAYKKYLDLEVLEEEAVAECKTVSARPTPEPSSAIEEVESEADSLEAELEELLAQSSEDEGTES